MKIPSPGSTSSMACGIIGCTLSIIPFVGLTIGIIAIVQSNKALKKYRESPDSYFLSGQRTTGLVLGIIATCIGSISSIFGLFGIIGGLIVTGRPFDF